MMRPGHLRATRLRLGLSQREVGAACLPRELEQSQVSQAEYGRGSNIERVARALADIIRDRSIFRGHNARRDAHLAAEVERIKYQEAMWNALPDSPAKAALLDAMIDRCFDLMCEGNGEACDAIAEWLPPDRVQAMFAAWETWTTEGTTARSSHEASDTQP